MCIAVGESFFREFLWLRSAESDSEDESRPLVPTPSHDHRPPVVDSYDVVEASKS